MRPQVSERLFVTPHWPFALFVKPVFDMVGFAHYVTAVLPQLPFRQDGVVFTDLFQPAYPFKMAPLSVLKWKQHLENTIDYIVTSCTPDVRPLRHLPIPAPGFPIDSYRAKERLSWHNCMLWVPTSSGENLPFSYAHSPFHFEEGQVFECGWEPQTSQWSLKRLRNKHANQLETVVNTIRNLVENIQLQELFCVSYK